MKTRLHLACSLTLLAAFPLSACVSETDDSGSNTDPEAGEPGDGDGDNAAATGGDDGTGSGGATGGTNAGTGAATSTGGADGTGGDGTGGDAGGTGGGLVSPPEGKVGVFVAAGHGARTIVSCDDGRTWVGNDQSADVDEDHSEYTEKGFVYGDGQFVLAMGWGADTSVKVSTNGIDWTRHFYESGGGGLAYLDDPSPKFITTNGWTACSTATDPSSWTRCPEGERPDYQENVREVQGGGSFVGMGGDIAALFSFDAGQTWANGAGCDLTGGFGNLGQSGGFAYGNGIALAVGDGGDYCATSDSGSNWSTGNFSVDGKSEPADGKMAFLGDEFWAPGGDHAYTSANGTDWTLVEFEPEGTVIHAMARSSETGTYVGVQRVREAPARFYWSDDGETWNLVMGPTGPSLRRVAFGFVDASETCPE